MSKNIAPWLQGLDDGWGAPAQAIITSNISSAIHDADSLRQSTSRIPQRSLSGLPSSISTKRTDSTSRRRPPLAQLNSNDTNTLNRVNGSVRITGTRSVSAASEGSLLTGGTVQQRSKSASPSKKQETMEWKRRLVHGNVGYGDQTDLFGANGLENIFARTANAENEEPRPKHRMSWLPKSDMPMPSSPPPWPSSGARRRDGSGSQIYTREDSLAEPEVSEPSDVEGSFRSNPFDLQNTEDDLDRSDRSGNSAKQERLSSPNKAFVEVTQESASGNRTVSGQTDIEQEDFSPVFISKTKTLNGFDYAALDSHLFKQFNSMKIDLRHPSQEQTAKSTTQPAQSEVVEQSTFTDGPESESLPTVPDISFSENLPTGSPFPNLGKNVEMKRGGYSNYGSFKQRPLSPSQSTREVSLNPSGSGLLSPIPSERHQSARAPTPPNAPCTPKQESETKSRSSGSPLKLFGAHDTFTSNRLLRRLSQLNPDGTLKLGAVAESSPQDTPREASRQVSSASSFGEGQLDGHGFSAEITVTSASDSGKSDSDKSPGSDVMVPGSKTPFAFHYDQCVAARDTFKMKRKLSKHSVATSRGSTLETQRRVSNDRAVPATDSKVYAEGKRPPTSPFKNPTPKRRRTLHASELEDGIADMNFSYHSQLQEAVSSRKRGDARSGEALAEADPDALAQRKILRPRNPTPSQRRRQQIEAELRQAAEDFAEQEPEKLEAVMEQIESSIASDEPQTIQQQAQTLASEVAAFTLNVQKPSGEHDGERKRSVTTQDFLDEAMMVMNLIRAKARPQSNLGSVEESDAEAFGQSTRPEDSDEDQSHLRVSRPPSREGSGWRTRASPTANARVISHLKKFQERDDHDDTGFIGNTMVSLRTDDEEHLNDHVLVVDEHSNIRITGPRSDYERAQETDSTTDSHRSNGSATNTQSTQNSTGRTIGTSSTRKSDNVGTLAPDAVAHLIGEQVGGMTFDREKQRWMRVTRSPPKHHGSFLELPSNVTSDDDPFREISDLPVDEQKELRRISSPGKLAENISKDNKEDDTHGQGLAQDDPPPAAESRTSSNETVVPRPVTRDSSHIQPVHSSSVPSKYTGFASSQQQEKVETRATSWSDEELARMSAIGKARQNLAQQMRNLPTVQEPTVERASNANEMTFPRPPNHWLPNGTAKFQQDSELAIYEEEGPDKLSGLRDNTAVDIEEFSIGDIDSPKLRQTPSKTPFPTSTYRGAARQMSLRRQTLTNRFTADAHESSELSLVAPLPGHRMMSLSLSVSRPVSTRQHPSSRNDQQSSPSKGAASFLWSDLPDFTVHEEDAERPSEKHLATRLAQHAAAEVNDRYALAVKDLVKILTDVNEDEPYWEDLKRLDLQGRFLVSLYGLDDFCTRVQEMDVSDNALTHLNGAPYSVRRLRACGNQLSGLTGWNHLANLQVLDVSGNRLESLDGLANLVHLRELRADDNKIAHVEGILQLDGLVKLRLRRNRVKEVDFDGCALQSLTHLDLSANGHISLAGLGSLSALTELRLDGCHLKSGLLLDHWMPNLTSISLRDCGLDTLDVSNLPGLRQLIVDDNCLTSINGLDALRNLQLVSMRRQSLPYGKTLPIFDQPFETTTLHLSGSPLPASLALMTILHGIRHLDLANTGLHELPDDFGLKMPALRTLNLNFNSLKDIRPLLNLQKIEQLSLCGNKVGRLRKSIAALSKLPTLREVDLRDTPLTLGLYPNLTSTLSRNTSLIPKAFAQSPEGENGDSHLEQAEQARYCLPPADAAQDSQHQSRMDEDSKLRRRVYELLLANSCAGLNVMDGLPFDEGRRKEVVRRDGVWKKLVELGVLRRSEKEVDGESRS